METIETNEILCFWLDKNYVCFDVKDCIEETYRIKINMYEFLQWFDKNTIDEIKNKLIENIKNK